MKDIKQIQEENRKLILEAIHGCEYGEALFREIYFGCKLLDINGNESTVVLWEGESIDFLDRFNRLNCINEENFYKYFDVLGQPMTLSRVLLAFQRKWLLNNVEIHALNQGLVEITIIDNDDQTWNDFFWDLEIETLEQQSEETQIAINQLLTK